MFVAVEYIHCSLCPHTVIYCGTITLILDTAFGKHVFGVSVDITFLLIHPGEHTLLMTYRQVVLVMF
jgi:hypothetical protein